MRRQFTIADWNVKGHALREQAQVLASREWDVACLQEMTRESWPAFRETGDDGAVSFDHLSSLASTGPRYKAHLTVRGSDMVVHGD